MNKDHIKAQIQSKGTMLVLSADSQDRSESIDLVNRLHDQLLGVKLHIDITSANEHFTKLVRTIHDRDLLLILDRKFCDIPSTVHMQSQKLTEYADLVTAHAIAGPAVIEGLRENCLKNDCRILLVAEMSCEHGIDSAKVVKLAQDNKDIVAGFIAQQRLENSGDFIYFTPGIGSVRGGTHRYPFDVDTDSYIVGRAIYNSSNPEREAEKYISPQSALAHYIKPYVVKKGRFLLKAGGVSDTYVDLRTLISYPKILGQVCKQLGEIGELGELGPCNVVLVGVPTGALPITTTLSQQTHLPMVLLRDKIKSYGLQRLIEGEITSDTSYIVIEDVITTGSSVLEFIERLKEASPGRTKIVRVLSLLDRECGGLDNLRAQGYDARSLFTLNDFNGHMD
jgi:orotidine 5'-phosphate decarboxylase subfamily 1/orotate phosphoribosyltransferase